MKPSLIERIDNEWKITAREWRIDDARAHMQKLHRMARRRNLLARLGLVQGYPCQFTRS
jgi:hypothetical protein